MLEFSAEFLAVVFLVLGVLFCIGGFTQAEATRADQYFTDFYFYVGLLGVVLVYVSAVLTANV